MFLYLNTGKESVTINQRVAAGRELFRDLVRQADILIEDLPVKRARQLGVTYRALKMVNRQLVMVSVTGFGRTGPRAWYKATDLVSVAAGGLALTMPNADPETGHGAPLRGGARFGHASAALNAAFLAVAALMRRSLTGKGTYIDISEQETVLHNVARHLTQYTVDGQLPLWAMSQSYGGSSSMVRCKDGYIHLFLTDEEVWQALLDVMGRPAWGGDERFRERQGRGANWNEIEPRLEAWCMERTSVEVFYACQARGIPCAPVNTPDRLIADPHVQARGALVQVDGLTMPGAPVRLTATPHAIRHPAPGLGQHTEAVLSGWLGYGHSKIENLRRDHAI